MATWKKVLTSADDADYKNSQIGTGNGGLVPAQGTSGDFLKHDGTFGTPSYTVNTDTTYSVEDGGLSEINFTSADHTKLNGIAASANNYTHPATHSISEVSGLQTSLDGKASTAHTHTEYDPVGTAVAMSIALG